MSITEMPGSVLNPSILITILITVISIVIGMFLGHNLSSQKTKPSPKIIVRSPSDIAYALLKAQDGSEKYSEDDYANLINTLIELLDEQNHPDVDILHYIASEVVNKSNPSQIYEVWLIMAFRRLAIDPTASLPEPWFIEPVEPPVSENQSLPELDLSGISETSTDTEFENEAGPLTSPAPQNKYLEENEILSTSSGVVLPSDDLNQARIYTSKSKLVDLDLDMSAVD